MNTEHTHLDELDSGPTEVSTPVRPVAPISVVLPGQQKPVPEPSASQSKLEEFTSTYWKLHKEQGEEVAQEYVARRMRPMPIPSKVASAPPELPVPGRFAHPTNSPISGAQMRRPSSVVVPAAAADVAVRPTTPLSHTAPVPTAATRMAVAAAPSTLIVQAPAAPSVLIRSKPPAEPRRLAPLSAEAAAALIAKVQQDHKRVPQSTLAEAGASGAPAFTERRAAPQGTPGIPQAPRPTMPPAPGPAFTRTYTQAAALNERTDLANTDETQVRTNALLNDDARVAPVPSPAPAPTEPIRQFSKIDARSQAGLPPIIEVPDAIEDTVGSRVVPEPGLPPADAQPITRFRSRKPSATIVGEDGRVLAKPATAQDARTSDGRVLRGHNRFDPQNRADEMTPSYMRAPIKKGPVARTPILKRLRAATVGLGLAYVQSAQRDIWDPIVFLVRSLPKILSSTAHVCMPIAMAYYFAQYNLSTTAFFLTGSTGAIVGKLAWLWLISGFIWSVAYMAGVRLKASVMEDANQFERIGQGFFSPMDWDTPKPPDTLPPEDK